MNILPQDRTFEDIFITWDDEKEEELAALRKKANKIFFERTFFISFFLLVTFCIFIGLF